MLRARRGCGIGPLYGRPSYSNEQLLRLDVKVCMWLALIPLAAKLHKSLNTVANYVFAFLCPQGGDYLCCCWRRGRLGPLLSPALLLLLLLLLLLCEEKEKTKGHYNYCIVWFI